MIAGARRIALDHAGLTFSGWEVGDGSPVLLLHGFPDTPATWADQLPALAAAGHRAVAVTLRGYEPSSQPTDGDYHTVRMAEDAVAWADRLGGRVHLVGHDWGATIAHAAAVLAPERFASLTMIAVPHPGRFGALAVTDVAQMARSDYIMAFQSPDADTTVARDDFAYLETLWRRWSPGWRIPESDLAAMKRAFAAPGVIAAALAYYRQATDMESEAGQASIALLLADVPVPTLGIVGADDGCIGADLFARAMDPAMYPTGVRVETIAGAGHFVHREASARVNGMLLDWFAANSA